MQENQNHEIRRLKEENERLKKVAEQGNEDKAAGGELSQQQEQPTMKAPGEPRPQEDGGIIDQGNKID